MLIAFAALVWPPVLYNVASVTGRYSLRLVAMFWHFHTRGQHRSAGASIGLAAAVKLLSRIGFYLRAAPRAIVWMVVVVAGALGLPLYGWGPIPFGHSCSRRRRMSHTGRPFPRSRIRFTVCLQADGRRRVGASALPRAAAGPRAGRALGRLFLIVSPQQRFADRAGTAKGEGARFAAWVALLVVLNPLAMAHTGVILALPIILIAQELSADHRLWPKLAWMAGVVLVSIPGHTLIFLASMPFETLAGCSGDRAASVGNARIVFSGNRRELAIARRVRTLSAALRTPS